MSHKKYSIVCSASAAGWGGNWPFVWIKSTLIVLVLRMGHMTEMQLEAHCEAGGPNSSSARVSFLLRKRGRKSLRVCPWTKSSRFHLCPHSENVLLQEWMGVYTMSWTSVCYFNLRRALPWCWAGPVGCGPSSQEGQAPGCGLSEQRPEGVQCVTWMCPEVRCES